MLPPLVATVNVFVLLSIRFTTYCLPELPLAVGKVTVMFPLAALAKITSSLFFAV